MLSLNLFVSKGNIHFFIMNLELDIVQVGSGRVYQQVYVTKSVIIPHFKITFENLKLFGKNEHMSSNHWLYLWYPNF